MKSIFKSFRKTAGYFGFDTDKAKASLKGLRPYLRDKKQLKSQVPDGGSLFPFGRSFPCLDDRFTESGVATGHYFHQDLLVARRIFVNNPQSHFDVGSRIDGFVAHVAVFRKIMAVDIRPLISKTPNIEFLQADMMGTLPDHLLNSCDSLSSLHAVEHFGLGRYGDPVKWDGYLTGLENLYLMLKPGGKFYFSVPIGPQRIEFNAHRVFSIGYLISLFEKRYSIDHFSYVDNKGDLHENVTLTPEGIATNFGCKYGCGIFELTKI